MEIHIVSEQACPTCGAVAGHPDADLDWPNRTKVHDGEYWWWRCYNPKCGTRYYLPETGETEPEPTPEEAEATRVRMEALRAQLQAGSFEKTGDGSYRFVPAKEE